MYIQAVWNELRRTLEQLDQMQDNPQTTHLEVVKTRNKVNRLRDELERLTVVN